MPVKSKQTLWLITLAVFLLFVIITLVLDRTLTLTPDEHLFLRLGLILLGLIAAVLVFWYLRPRDSAANVTSGDDAVLVIGAAKSKLPRGSFDKRSLVLIAGAENSCKTTLVTRSGMGAELLAGDATRTGSIDAPTKSANVWLLQQALVIEGGPAVLIDAPRWQKFIHALRGARIAAAFGRGEPSPRSIVVCVSCELFYSGGAGEQLDALAAATRQRLADAAKEFGMELPVYVMFTKMDKIPHFEDWAAPFAKEEALAPLGAAIPFESDRSAGLYAERLGARLNAAFDELISSLATRRLILLGRDNVFTRRLGAYEFPREMRKLVPTASKFLTELCRPMQLGSSPQLRGFYFMGARPVIVRDVASAPVLSNAAAPGRSADATSIFMRGTASPVAASAAGSAPVERKVPEWMFTERFFPDVVLADKGAASTARGGQRVSGLRRVMLASAMVACLLLALGVSVSWVGNRGLANRTVDAARAVKALPVVQAQPGTIAHSSPEALQRLDNLRSLLDTLRGYQADGAPLHLRWGLWRGNALLTDALPVWFDGFRRELFTTAWGAMVDSLRALPDAPKNGDDSGRPYSWLKAYLITTSYHDSSTTDFLPPVLLNSWQRGVSTDADITNLARRQFEFYSTELKRENPYAAAQDANLVTRARGYLARFSGAEPVYRSMLSDAAKKTPPIKFAAAIPDAAGIVSGATEVSGEFTEPGWRFMQDAFRDPAKYFKGEPWVVGDASARMSQNQDAILAELRSRYRGDYIGTWRTFLRAGNVVVPSTTQDAATKVGLIGSAQSPLLHLLALVARNTNTDSLVAKAFQPVHSVTPPDVKDKFVSPANEGYAKELSTLQGVLELVGNMPPATDTPSTQARVQAALQALGQVNPAKAAARTLSQKFSPDTAALQISPKVSALLLAPITGAELMLQNESRLKPMAKKPVAAAPAPPSGGGKTVVIQSPTAKSDPLNRRGQNLCISMQAMTAKFPFTATASAEATTDDIKSLLSPVEGELFKFQKEDLAPYLVKQGDEYVAKPGDGVTLTPAFVTFFNRAAKVSAALFPRGSGTPHAIYSARGLTVGNVTQIRLTGAGGEGTFDSGKSAAFSEYNWPSPPNARLIASFKRGSPITVASADGDWAMFRLVGKAKFDKVEEELYRAEWPATGKDAQPVQIEFRLRDGPILQKDWMGNQLRCTAQVAQ